MRETVTLSQATIYCKTGAGLEEMQKRQAGLNPRVRQLLILIDGKRSSAELQRLMAVSELEEFLSLLELKGLIANVSDESPEVALIEKPAEPVVAPLSPPFVGQAAEHEVTVNPDTEHLLAMRLHLGQTLAQAVGPMADPMCQRISAAQKPHELLELFEASLTVVELMSGRKAAERFVEKMKSLGWEY